MENWHLSGLRVCASGVYPVELSVGKRVNGHHRIPVRASVEVSTGEVRFLSIRTGSRSFAATQTVTDPSWHSSRPARSGIGPRGRTEGGCGL